MDDGFMKTGGARAKETGTHEKAIFIIVIISIRNSDVRASVIFRKTKNIQRMELAVHRNGSVVILITHAHTQRQALVRAVCWSWFSSTKNLP